MLGRSFHLHSSCLKIARVWNLSSNTSCVSLRVDIVKHFLLCLDGLGIEHFNLRLFFLSMFYVFWQVICWLHQQFWIFVYIYIHHYQEDTVYNHQMLFPLSNLSGSWHKPTNLDSKDGDTHENTTLQQLFKNLNQICLAFSSLHLYMTMYICHPPPH